MSNQKIDPAGMSEQQQAIRKRRKVLDLDLDAYLNVKSKLLELLQLARRGNIEQINDHDLSKIGDDLDFLFFKTRLNLNLDALTYRKISAEFERFDTDLSKRLVLLIDGQIAVQRELKQKIARASEFLGKRKELNDVAARVLKHSNFLRITKHDFDELFDEDIDVKVILSSAKVINPNSEDPNLIEYVFDVKASKSLSLSCDNLASLLEDKIKQFDELRESVSTKQRAWVDIAGKVKEAFKILTGSTESIIRPSTA